MDEVKLALELNKVVHDECKDVPHDIGLRLLEVVKKHLGEQLNLPPVVGQSEQYCECGKAHGMHEIDNNHCDKCEKKIFP